MKDGGNWKARGLELEEDPAFHRLNLRLQRIGTYAIFALLVAALLGAFGAGGPFDRAKAGSPAAGLTVEYARFARFASSSQLRVRALPAADELRLELDRGYLDGVRVEWITPTPADVISEPERVRYRFAALPGALTDITLHLQMDTIGPHRGRLRVDGGPELAITQFVYP